MCNSEILMIVMIAIQLAAEVRCKLPLVLNFCCRLYMTNRTATLIAT